MPGPLQFPWHLNDFLVGHLAPISFLPFGDKRQKWVKPLPCPRPRIPSPVFPPHPDHSSPRMELPPLSPGIQVRVMDEAEVLETVRRGWSGGTVRGRPPPLSTRVDPVMGCGGSPMMGRCWLSHTLTPTPQLSCLPFHVHLCSPKSLPLPWFIFFHSMTFSRDGIPTLSPSLCPPGAICLTEPHLALEG